MTLGNVEFINMTQKGLIKKKRLLHGLQWLIIKKKSTIRVKNGCLETVMSICNALNRGLKHIL